MVRARLAVSAIFVGFACVSATMCLPHPEGDFDDFVERTNGLRDGMASTGGTGVAPSEPFSALFIGRCITQFSAEDPDRVFRFYTKVDYTTDAPPRMDAATPDAATSNDASSTDAGGDADPDAAMTPMDSGTSVADAGPPPAAKPIVGTIKLSVTALIARDAMGVQTPPPTVSQSLVTGATIMGTSAVAADGKFLVDLGALDVKENANAVSARDVKLDPIAMDGRLADTQRFCAQLKGNLLLPVMATLDPTQNVCIFERVEEGAPMPATIPFVDYVCP